MDRAKRDRQTIFGQLLRLMIYQMFWAAGSAGIPAQGAEGRYVALGMTDVSDTWKDQHSNDEHFLYVLNSTTGRIEICRRCGSHLSFAPWK